MREETNTIEDWQKIIENEEKHQKSLSSVKLSRSRYYEYRDQKKGLENAGFFTFVLGIILLFIGSFFGLESESNFTLALIIMIGAVIVVLVGFYLMSTKPSIPEFKRKSDPMPRKSSKKEPESS
jgi:hypothetical protein